MTKIYVVMQGEYSDKHICGIFDDLKLAQTACQCIKDPDEGDDAYGQPRVETYDLNCGGACIEQGYKYYCVMMQHSGDVRNCEPINYCDGEFIYELREEYPPQKPPIIFLLNHCFAKDPQHAVKITNEIRVQLIANDQWKLIDEDEYCD